MSEKIDSDLQKIINNPDSILGNIYAQQGRIIELGLTNIALQRVLGMMRSLNLAEPVKGGRFDKADPYVKSCLINGEESFFRIKFEKLDLFESLVIEEKRKLSIETLGISKVYQSERLDAVRWMVEAKTTSDYRKALTEASINNFSADDYEKLGSDFYKNLEGEKGDWARWCAICLRVQPHDFKTISEEFEAEGNLESKKFAADLSLALEQILKSRNALSPQIDKEFKEIVLKEEAAKESSLELPEVGKPVEKKEVAKPITNRTELLKKAADIVTEGWHNGPNVILYDHPSQLPKCIRDEVSRESNSDIHAFFDAGNIFINALSTGDVQSLKEKILHEIKGHYGLKLIFGYKSRNYNQALDSVWLELQTDPDLMDKLAKRGGFLDASHMQRKYPKQGMTPEEANRYVAEECFALASEVYHDDCKPKPDFLSVAFTKVKKATNTLIPVFSLNDKDLVNLLGARTREILDQAGDAFENGSQIKW